MPAIREEGKALYGSDKCITYYIVKDSLPIHTVERSGFKAMLKAFDTRYDIPSRNYFRELHCRHSTPQQKKE